MLEHPSSGLKDIHCIELFSLRRTVEEKGIRIYVGDLILEWCHPKFDLWTVPYFEDGSLGNGDPGGAAIVYFYLRSVADGDVPGIGKLAATEEILADERRYDVYYAYRLA